MKDFFSDPFFLDWSFWARLGASLLCGGIIGLEREFHHKAAGLRTCTLISLGSCVFAMLSDMIARTSHMAYDPTRIAGQVVTGVGFLGAGAIIHQGFTVSGMTSAATIWVVAAVGVAAGVGFPLTAAVITACTILTLLPLGWLERHVLNKIPRSPSETRGPALAVRNESEKF
jgi:putative Mg2+ transporter-C (MgtC) family protein